MIFCGQELRAANSITEEQYRLYVPRLGGMDKLFKIYFQKQHILKSNTNLLNATKILSPKGSVIALNDEIANLEMADLEGRGIHLPLCLI